MPKIEKIFAFVAEDTGPDDEGVVGMSVGGTLLPLIDADMDRVECLRQVAHNIGVHTGKKIKLLLFTQREVLEESV